MELFLFEQSSETLIELDLSHNEIKNEADRVALAKAIKVNTTLEFTLISHWTVQVLNVNLTEHDSTMYNK